MVFCTNYLPCPMYMPSGSQFGIFLEITLAGAFECIGGFLAFILCSRVNRKELQLCLQTTIILLFIAAIILKHFEENDAKDWMVFVCRIFTIAQAINALALIGEIFPSTVKEAGLAFSIGLGRLSPILVPFIVQERDSETLWPICYVIILFCSLLNIILFLMLPETRGFSNFMTREDLERAFKKPERMKLPLTSITCIQNFSKPVNNIQAKM